MKPTHTLLFLACATSLAAQRAPDPGPPDRWVVQLRSRGFTLDALRSANLRRDALAAARIVAELEERAVAEQTGFATRVRELGGRVLRRWWLIHGCAIELDGARIDEVRRMPAVLRVEPDRQWASLIRRSTSARNHATDIPHALGYNGAGVAVAVLDTGQDESMGAAGRPHRTYFTNGDPSNRTGGGIGGSRLVVNRQIGALVADDLIGHGTAVAAVAAGASWGTPGADHGHAFGAGIAGYSILDSTVAGGLAHTSTIVSAWQAVVADRARLGIASANISWAGSPRLMDADQVAIDAAAFFGDILICNAAGNTGKDGPARSTTRSQGNANGLAVGAIEADTHRLAAFSSIGPLAESGGRTFPDLVGVGADVRTATANAESTDLVGSGTSLASPQVAGIAALLRAAAPGLTALQTKALLLAATQSVGDANPGLGRTYYGAGLARADVALPIALGGAARTDSVTAANPVRRLPFPVRRGSRYSVAVAWHRRRFDAPSYSNLDIRILDGNAPVAAGTSGVDLYEHVRFAADRDGTYTLEVRGIALEGGSETFAYAVATPAPGPVPGRVLELGAGCTGTGAPYGIAQALNQTGTQADLLGWGGIPYLVEVVAAADYAVEGFELRTRSNAGDELVWAGLYDADNGGAPNNLLATGALRVGATLGWARTILNVAVPVRRGQRFFVGFANPARSIVLPDLVSGSLTPYWYRLGARPWTKNEIFNVPMPPARWAYRILQRAGGRAAPLHEAIGTPLLGATVELQLEQAATQAAAFWLLGTSSEARRGATLPLDLGPLGAPACALRTSAELVAGLLTDGRGRAAVPLGIPNDRALVGARVYSQFTVVDQGANGLGLAWSDALSIVAGNAR